MIIGSSPLRVSFFGGGTDYPVYYQKYGGAVLSVAIDKRVCVIINPSNDLGEFKYIVNYSVIEKVNSIEEIKHPAIKRILEYFQIYQPVEIHILADMPARSGLGSSSAFTVSLIAAIYRFKSLPINPHEIGRIAVYLEQNVIKDKVGSQDQIAAAIGGFNKIEFGQDKSITTHPIVLEEKDMKLFFESFFLIYTKQLRFANDVTVDQIEKTKSGSLDKSLEKMKTLVYEAENYIKNKEFDDFGSLLDTSWRIKRSLTSHISNHQIDEIYRIGIASGALGGKLLGAGSGGFLLFYVPTKSRNSFLKEFEHAKPLRVDISSRGVWAKALEEFNE